ncbi:hypothetical protein Tco_1492756 [Tanacetum coccineum]
MITTPRVLPILLLQRLEEPVEEPIAEVVMDDEVNNAGEDVVHDDDQPQDTLEPKTNKTPKQDWFKQPPRPLTPDTKWNKRQVVLDKPEQPWFNQMVSAAKDPLTFNDLMATPIDFSKGKERACVYFKFPFVIKLQIGLSSLLEDPSPHGRILLPDSLLNSFHRGRTAKLRNDILMFQHHGESLSEAWTRFKDLLQKVPQHGIDLCGPHDPQYCMEDLEQAYVEYASSRTDEAGGLSKVWADFKQQQSEMTNKIDTVLKAITDRITGTLPNDTVKNPKLSTYPVLSARSYPKTKRIRRERDNRKYPADPLPPPNLSVTFITEKVLKFNSFFESLGLVPPLSNAELICTKEEDGDVMFIDIVLKDVQFRKVELRRRRERSGEQYDSLSNLEKEHTKSVFLRNEEDKRKGVEYVMSKILGFYKECLELGPEYLTGMDDEGEVT